MKGKLGRNPTPGKVENGINTSIYTTWCGMKQRCKCTTRRDSKHYSLKGVKVCDRWNKFQNFLEDMGPKPEGMTLHRLNSKKGYEPGNVVWADWKTQNRQSSHANILTFEGQRRSLSEWAEIKGINRLVISSRINAYGWTVKRSLTTPSRTLKRRGK